MGAEQCDNFIFGDALDDFGFDVTWFVVVRSCESQAG